jgi:hypothetical protein
MLKFFNTFKEKNTLLISMMRSVNNCNSCKAKARLIAEACSDAPEGQTRWTMQSLADRLVELKVVETTSD